MENYIFSAFLPLNAVVEKNSSNGAVIWILTFLSMTSRVPQCLSSPKDSLGGHARTFWFIITIRGKGLDNNDTFKNVSACYEA